MFGAEEHVWGGQVKRGCELSLLGLGEGSREQAEELESKEMGGCREGATLAKWEPESHFLTVSHIKASCSSSLSPSLSMCQSGGGRGCGPGSLWVLSSVYRSCDEEGKGSSKSNGRASSSLHLWRSRQCSVLPKPSGLVSPGPSCYRLIGRGGLPITS